MSSDANERQPLLPSAAVDKDQEIEGSEIPAKDDVLPKERSWSTIIWYTVLTALGIFFAVLFIKGFIEADDVNVSPVDYGTVAVCSRLH